jgi:hypothetical protein
MTSTNTQHHIPQTQSSSPLPLSTPATLLSVRALSTATSSHERDAFCLNKKTKNKQLKQKRQREKEEKRNATEQEQRG